MSVKLLAVLVALSPLARAQSFDISCTSVLPGQTASPQPPVAQAVYREAESACKAINPQPTGVVGNSTLQAFAVYGGSLLNNIPDPKVCQDAVNQIAGKCLSSFYGGQAVNKDYLFNLTNLKGAEDPLFPSVTIATTTTFTIPCAPSHTGQTSYCPPTPYVTTITFGGPAVTAPPAQNPGQGNQAPPQNNPGPAVPDQGSPPPGQNPPPPGQNPPPTDQTTTTTTTTTDQSTISTNQTTTTTDQATTTTTNQTTTATDQGTTTTTSDQTTTTTDQGTTTTDQGTTTTDQGTTTTDQATTTTTDQTTTTTDQATTTTDQSTTTPPGPSTTDTGSVTIQTSTPASGFTTLVSPAQSASTTY